MLSSRSGFWVLQNANRNMSENQCMTFRSATFLRKNITCILANLLELERMFKRRVNYNKKINSCSFERHILQSTKLFKGPCLRTNVQNKSRILQKIDWHFMQKQITFCVVVVMQNDVTRLL